MNQRLVRTPYMNVTIKLSPYMNVSLLLSTPELSSMAPDSLKSELRLHVIRTVNDMQAFYDFDGSDKVQLD